jgi:uncharacterized protein (TIGR00304 family)
MAIGLVVLFSSQKMPQEDDLAAQKEPVRGVQIKGGDVIMIGPLPIVMGSDSKTALIMMLMASATMVIWAMRFKGRR